MCTVFILWIKSKRLWTHKENKLYLKKHIYFIYKKVTGSVQELELELEMLVDIVTVQRLYFFVKFVYCYIPNCC